MRRSGTAHGRRSRRQCRTGKPRRTGGGRRGCGGGGDKAGRAAREGRPPVPRPPGRAVATPCQPGRRVDTLCGAGSRDSRGEHGRPGPQPAQHPQVHRRARRRRDRRAAAPRRHGGAVRRQPAAVAVHRGPRPRHAGADHRVAPLRQDAAVGAGRDHRLRRPRRRQVGGALDPGLRRLHREPADRGRTARPGGRVARRPPAAGARDRAARRCSASPRRWCRSPSSRSAGRRSARSRPTATTRPASTPSAGDGRAALPSRPAHRRAAPSSVRVDSLSRPGRGYLCHSTRDAAGAALRPGAGETGPAPRVGYHRLQAERRGEP